MIESAQAAENAFSRQHLVRVGAWGTSDASRRSTRSAIRATAEWWCARGRGLEAGRSARPARWLAGGRTADGSIVRGVTAEDELAGGAAGTPSRRGLRGLRAGGWPSCGSPAVLMDVEHLFDGRTLVFYFLGEMTQRWKR